MIKIYDMSSGEIINQPSKNRNKNNHNEIYREQQLQLAEASYEQSTKNNINGVIATTNASFLINKMNR
ncbi:MAG: hypothetical protein HON94_14685 [Methylococcales bacterium]|jgi:hypothetical protein|nr:hypothetical protein [Methylococcales bacterium]MBT7408768.1 hypothetical protein [Methylococcales bacterium]